MCNKNQYDKYSRGDGYGMSVCTIKGVISVDVPGNTMTATLKI